MILIQYIKKNFFNVFILAYLLIIILSVKVGISHDEEHHYLVWLLNKKIYSNFFLGSNYDVIFSDFGMQFYGIGFHIFSPNRIYFKLLQFDSFSPMG